MQFPTISNGTVSFGDDTEGGLAPLGEHGGPLGGDDGSKGNAGAKKKKKTGGFQSLGLSKDIFGGIMRLGYKVPTPIQRKSLPISLSGRDVVAMARTGSGKTAAFLIPLLERLGAHSSTVGARGLVLSPTRELCQQTYKFAVRMAKFTSLRTCMLQGGDKLEAQFEALANNPDILVATPGRLVHLLAEVPNFGLKRIEVFVVDEADRLFEMGFALQLKEILDKMPDQRQTLLFSATMPVQLMEFARAGLEDPELIRLDAETKVSENLKLAFFMVRSKEKMAALVHLLTEVIPKDDLTIVFTATRHHVDMVKEMLWLACGIDCSVAYGSMDMQARKDNLDRFRAGKSRVLLVTDVAARGIDIPLLNNVVNLEFPGKPKLFVHRVGRAARQGRSGTAYSFVTQDELPYVLDLHLFLGRPLRGFVDPEATDASARDQQQKPYTLADMTPDDVDIGRFPQHILDSETERGDRIVEGSPELAKLLDVVGNAHSLYTRTRQEPSRRSVKRAKELGSMPAIHPLLAGNLDENYATLDKHLEALRSFRPSLTVFEVEALKKGKPVGDTVMAMMHKRATHQEIIAKEKDRKATLGVTPSDDSLAAASDADVENGGVGPRVSESRERAAARPDSGSTGAAPNKKRLSKAERKRIKKHGTEPVPAPSAVPAASQPNASNPDASITFAVAAGIGKGGAQKFKDEATYIEAMPREYDAQASLHLSISARPNDETREISRSTRLEEALLDLTPDDHNDLAAKQRMYQWDKRKKRYIKASLEEHVKSKRVKNEAGAIIKIKNRGEIYERWQRNTRRASANVDGGNELSDDGASDAERGARNSRHTEKQLTDVKHIALKNKTAVVANAHLKNEVKDEKTIRAERKEKEKRAAKNARTPKTLRKGKAEALGPDGKRLRGGDLAREKYKPRAKGEAIASRFARSRIVTKKRGPPGKDGAAAGRGNKRRR